MFQKWETLFYFSIFLFWLNNLKNKKNGFVVRQKSLNGTFPYHKRTTKLVRLLTNLRLQALDIIV